MQLNDNRSTVQTSDTTQNTKSLLNFTGTYMLDADKLSVSGETNQCHADIPVEQSLNSVLAANNNRNTKLLSSNDSPSPSIGLRKRNVNWDLSTAQSKSHTAAIGRMANANRLLENQQNNVIAVNRHTRQTGDDDGFESLNGRSSGEDNSGVPVLLFPMSNGLRVPTTTDSETDSLRRSRKPSKSIDSIAEEASSTTAGNVYGKKLPKPNATTSRSRDSTDTDEEGDDGEQQMSPVSNSNFSEVATSTTEWIGHTTNSEDCSYNSSEIEHSASQYDNSENGGEYELAPAVLLNPISGTGDRSK